MNFDQPQNMRLFIIIHVLYSHSCCISLNIFASDEGVSSYFQFEINLIHHKDFLKTQGASQSAP